MDNNSIIRSIRLARGLTLKDVAERVGTTETTISRWEREPQRVTIPVLNKLAAALGCTVQELISRAASEPKQTYIPVPDLEDEANGMVWDACAVAAIVGADVKNLAYIIMRSDVMAPTISPGDLLTVDRGRNHVDFGGIYALRVSGQVLLRRCIPMAAEAGGIRVSVDNALYGPSHPVNADQLEILGRVVSVTKTFT